MIPLETAAVGGMRHACMNSADSIQQPTAGSGVAASHL